MGSLINILILQEQHAGGNPQFFLKYVANHFMQYRVLPILMHGYDIDKAVGADQMIYVATYVYVYAVAQTCMHVSRRDPSQER